MNLSSFLSMFLPLFLFVLAAVHPTQTLAQEGESSSDNSTESLEEGASAASALSTQKVRQVRSNPELSVNTLLYGRVSEGGNNPLSETPNGIGLQELEIRATSNVDAYFRADVTLAVEKEPGEEFAVEPEEVYIETLSLPEVSLKVGKFLAQFGRHNSLHTHAFPFVNPPLANEMILGEEGLNEFGVQAAYLVPAPWYLELVAEGFTPQNNELFNTSSLNRVGGVFALRNLWEISDSSTLSFDIGYGTAVNSFGRHTHLSNLSSTFKTGNGNQLLSLTGEYMRADQLGATVNEHLGGVAFWVQYQPLRQYAIQGRWDYVGLPSSDEGNAKRYSILLGYLPTEYSAIRLQYDAISEPGESKLASVLTLQLNMSIGAHPAHEY